MADCKVEMLFAHLKRILKLGRLRLRGGHGTSSYSPPQQDPDVWTARVFLLPSSAAIAWLARPYDLLVPFPSELITIWPVSTSVNKPKIRRCSIRRSLMSVYLTELNNPDELESGAMRTLGRQSRKQE